MRHERIVRRVPHQPGRMFSLVADIERYPEFVPGCTGMRVLRRTREGDIEHVIAEMEVGHRLISETFTCRVRLDRAALAIDVEFIEGPFTELVNHWRFAEADGGCEIDFRIDFELKSRHLGVIVAVLFDRVLMRLVDAFEKRAEKMLRPRGPAIARPARA